MANSKLFPTFAAIVVLALTWLAAPASAQVPSREDIAKLSSQLSEIQQRAAHSGRSISDLEASFRRASEIRRLASNCVPEIRDEISRLNTLIGESPPAEPGAEEPAAAAQEPSPPKATAHLQGILKTCQELVLRADSTVSTVEQSLLNVRLSQFESRGRNVVASWRGMAAENANWDAVRAPFARMLALPYAPGLMEWLLVGGLALVGAIFGFRMRKEVPGHIALAPMLFGAAGALTGLTIGYVGQPATVLVMGWQLLAILCLMALSALLPRPDPDAGEVQFGWRIGSFLLAVMLAYHLDRAFEQALPIPPIEFVRHLVFAALLITAVPATRHIRYLTMLGSGWRFARAIFLIGFVIAVLAEAAGYRNYASFVMFGFAGSLAALILYTLIERGGEALIETLNTGNTQWSVAFKRRFGFPPHDKLPGLFWVRMFFELIVFAAFVLAVLTAWGLSEASREIALQYAIDGFDLWGIHIVPGRIIGGLLVFGILMMVSRRIRDTAERRWTSDLDVDAGGREALVTLIGYAGILVALIAGLSWAGFDLQNLALVAGALSVGIGFGLQNIVSNFVSGLILLFERPIRTGDWVIIGSTEGIVKKISVRATQIQTFDRTEVIVPNADLISGQVTNYTLSNNTGRAVLSVGVAYGSDTQLVRDILYETACAHPAVITDGTDAPPPLVTFEAFGDSSLDFEVRAWLHNVNERVHVVSELNFAIDKAFREHEIEIPFPQRDLHVRDWPRLKRERRGD